MNGTLETYNKKTYICVTAVLEGEDKEGGGEKALKEIQWLKTCQIWQQT